MITSGKVVTVAYTLLNSDEQVLDQADASNPFIYLHGANQLVPGFESSVEGLKAGDKKSFDVTPADGYGEFNPELQMAVHRSQFPENIQVEPGMQFETQTPDGQEVVFTVEEVDGEQIFINGNHPLAGETLHFDVEIIEIRSATEEELAHGHAHDPSGAHHH